MEIAGIVAGLYLLLMAGVTLNQRQMMYFPTQAPLAALEPIAASHQFQSWNNAAGDHIGWKRLGPRQTACAQVLILHGNAAEALAWVDFAEALQKSGAFDVFILEFPGYGARPGKPSQKRIFQAAVEGLTLLDKERKIYLVGESLGTGVATYLAGGAAGEKPGTSIAGVLLIGPYNNMAAVAQTHIRIFPVRLLLWDRYASDRYLKNYSGPVGFLVGGRDQVIPSRYGRRLYDGYRGPKRLWEVPQAGHDDLHHQPLEWWKEAVGFWSKPT